MAKRCRDNDKCRKPRAKWWKDALGIRSYYYNQSSGGYRVGTGAHSVSDLESDIATLPEGTEILFKKGETFEIGEIDISVNNLSFGSYGSGADPVLTGSIDIGGQTWTHEGSNIYSTPYSGSVDWLYVNGVAAKLAESPWYTITAQPAADTRRASTLAGDYASTLVGAQVVVKEYYFTYSHVRTITGYTDGTGEIVLDDDVRFPSANFLNGFAFKMFNQQQFITSAGDWFYDTTADLLYYKTSGGSPSSLNIRICTKDEAFALSEGVTGTTFDGLEFTEYFNSAINGKTNHNTTVTNCNINNIRTNGIFLYGPATGVTITNNTVSKCGQNGFLFGGLINPTVTGNTMETFGREYTLPFMQFLGSTFADWEQTQGCGIVFTYDKTSLDFAVDEGTVNYNTVSDCAYCGINWTGSLDEVAHNRVDLVMRNFEDGAGIYCVANPQAPYFSNTIGTNIHDNIVTNVEGLYSNCPTVHPSLNSWGIYVDYQCDAITVSDNIIKESQGGLIKINYGNRNNIVTDNICLGGVYGIQFNNYESLYNANTGNTFTGNVIGTSFYPVTWSDVDGDASYNPFTGGSSNNNFYLNPYGNVVGRRLTTGSVLSYTLAAFRTLFGGDAGSTGSPIATYLYSGDFARSQELKMEINETDASVSYDIPAGFVDKSGGTADITIPANSAAIIIKTSSVAIVYDTFTGVNGTAIASHAPDVGGAWTLRQGTITINSNTLVASVTGNCTQTTAESDVNIMVQAGKGTTGNINILLRHNGLSGSGNESYIWLFWGSDLISLIQHTPGVDTTLASAAQLLAASTNYYLEAQVIGDRIIIKVDNEVRIDYTGLTLNPSSLIHGIRQNAAAGALTNNFAITAN